MNTSVIWADLADALQRGDTRRYSDLCQLLFGSDPWDFDVLANMPVHSV